MTENERQRMALCMLADYDARTPGELFSRPVDLTIPQSYELQSEIARLREERGEKIIDDKAFRCFRRRAHPALMSGRQDGY